MKYKIYDKVNKEFLLSDKYCINQDGNVMTTKGVVLMNQDDFEILEDNEELLQALKDLWSVRSEPWTDKQMQLKFEVSCKVEDVIKKYTKDL